MRNLEPSNKSAESMPFYVGAAVLAVWASSCLFLKPDIFGTAAPWVSSMVIIVAVVLACVPTFQKNRYQALALFSATMRDVSEAVGDLDKVKREHGANRQHIQGVVGRLDRCSGQLLENLDRFEKIALAQKRIEEELISSKQIAGQASKLIESWEQTAVDYLQSMERILSFPDIDPSLRKATERAVKDFVGLTRSLGFDLIRPEKNSVLSEQDCIVEGIETSSDVEPDRVVRCTSWGFRKTSGPPIKARVVLASSGSSATDPNEPKHRREASKAKPPAQVADKVTGSSENF